MRQLLAVELAAAAAVVALPALASAQSPSGQSPSAQSPSRHLVRPQLAPAVGTGARAAGAAVERAELTGAGMTGAGVGRAGTAGAMVTEALRSRLVAESTVRAEAATPVELARAAALRARRLQLLAGPAATASWCAEHGSQLSAWTGTVPDLPICGPGPAYGGSWSYVDLPGPGGLLDGYFNATPGFQCVELAERWLAVGKGLAPIEANGSEVAANYHAAYPNSLLVVNASQQAVDHPPVAGDVISFSTVPSFLDPTDGHVAVVVASNVDADGDGEVLIAQQNVSASDYRMTLGLADWRLYDPSEPADAEFQYPYAEWFQLLPPPAVVLAARQAAARAAAVARARSAALDRRRMRRVEIAARALLAAARRPLEGSQAVRSLSG